MTPRLSLLAGYDGTHEGSFIPMVRALAAGAEDRGWPVELIFQEWNAGLPWYERLRSEVDGDVLTAPEGGWRRLAEWLERRVAEPGPLVLHTHFTRFDLPAAAVARRRPKTAVLWHVHTPLRQRSSVPRNLVKFGMVGRSVDAILAAGPDPAQGMLRAGAPRERVHVVGGGVEAERFSPASPEQRRGSRRRLGIEEGATMLLHFAWDWWLKDGDLFLESVRALADRDPARDLLGLTVRGGDQARESIARLALDRCARAIEAVDCVNDLYAAADLFVSSSRVEGQPFAVIEAILSGLPVVASDLPGHRDICDGLSSCRVVERSPEALAEAAAELLARPPEEATEAARQARERTAARFDLDAWTERMFERYERCLASRVAAPRVMSRLRR